MFRFANALANANARRSPCLARRSVKLTTVHTSHYHLLQGTSGCAMARFMFRFANALANANARRSPCLARRSVKLTAVHTSHYHLLQGTSGCAMARLMSRFAIALANANARRSPCLARRSVKPTENAGRSLVLAYVPFIILKPWRISTTVKWNTTGLDEHREVY